MEPNEPSEGIEPREIFRTESCGGLALINRGGPYVTLEVFETAATFYVSDVRRLANYLTRYSDRMEAQTGKESDA